MMAAKYRPHVHAYALPVRCRIPRRRPARAPPVLQKGEVRRIYQAAGNVDIVLVGIGGLGGHREFLLPRGSTG